MRRLRIAAVAAVLHLPLLSGGCQDAAEPAAAPAEDAVMDGLSPDQIRRRAEPMSPERAAELGIIDTTIHLEQLTSPADSALLSGPQMPAASDTSL